MANEIEPPEPDLSNIRKHLRTNRPLLLAFGWGSAAAVALTCLAITTQTQSGSERLQLAFAPASPPQRAVAAADVPTRVIGIDKEAVRLEAQLRVLAADRDRLAARVALLERNLDDMTGSIKRQAAQETPAATPAVASTPTPEVAAPASQPAAAPPARSEVPIIAPLALPAQIGTAASWPVTPEQPAAAPAPEQIPLPAARMALAPATEPTAETPRKLEIGVDLGGAPNMEVLTMRWAAVKANFGPMLTGMHALAARVQRPRSSDVRLLVGPLHTITAANQLCARFAAVRVTCRPVKFDGERLAEHPN